MVYTPYRYRHTRIISLWCILRKGARDGKGRRDTSATWDSRPSTSHLGCHRTTREPTGHTGAGEHHARAIWILTLHPLCHIFPSGCLGTRTSTLLKQAGLWKAGGLPRLPRSLRLTV